MLALGMVATEEWLWSVGGAGNSILSAGKEPKVRMNGLEVDRGLVSELGVGEVGVDMCRVGVPSGVEGG